MLILVRKPQEAIYINDNIKVMVLGTKGEQVRIGIEAPREVNIRREEIPPQDPAKKILTLKKPTLDLKLKQLVDKNSRVVNS